MTVFRIACGLLAVSSWVACAGRSEEQPVDAGLPLALQAVQHLPEANDGCVSPPDCAIEALPAQCLRVPPLSTCYVLVATSHSCAAPLRPVDKELVARAGLEHVVQSITCQLDHDPARCPEPDGGAIDPHSRGWCYASDVVPPRCVLLDGFKSQMLLPALGHPGANLYFVCEP